MLSEKPWRMEAVIVVCAAILVSFGCSGIATELLRKLGVAGFQQQEGPGPILFVTLGFQGMSWIFMVIFFRWHRVRLSDALGFHGPELKRALRLAVLATAVLLPAAWLLQALSLLVLTKLGWEPGNQHAVTLFENSSSDWLRVYLGVFAVGIAPVAEEFIFRGMLYPSIKQLGFPRLALFGVSLAFAAIHLDAGTFVPLFVIALAFTWLYEKTDNLLAPIAAHMLFNAVNLARLILSQPGALPGNK